LFKQGMSIREIDEMDIIYFFRLLRRQREKKNPTAYVDQIPFL